MRSLRKENNRFRVIAGNKKGQIFDAPPPPTPRPHPPVENERTERGKTAKKKRNDATDEETQSPGTAMVMYRRPRLREPWPRVRGGSRSVGRRRRRRREPVNDRAGTGVTTGVEVHEETQKKTTTKKAPPPSSPDLKKKQK